MLSTYRNDWNGRNDDRQLFKLLYFEYKTYTDQVFKIKANTIAD